MSERPIRAALYCRVSTDEQREAKTIGTQVDFAQRWFELHGIPCVATYLDDGISGTLPLDQRPEGIRLLADAEARAWDVLYVYMIDRLGRHPRHILNAVATLEGNGRRVVSMTEPFDTATPAGRLTLTMLSAIAGFARDVLVERCTEGHYSKAAQGIWVGGPAPYGYRIADRWLVPNEAPEPGCILSPADVIRLIYQRLGRERGTCYQVAEELQALGAPTPNRAPHWRASTVHALAKSSVYRGEFIYGKQGQGSRPPRSVPVPELVEPGLWREAQEQLQRNRKKAPGNCRREYLLRGLIKCRLCGLTYCGFPVQRGTYYRCRGKYKDRGAVLGEKCASPHLPQSAEEIVWEEARAILLSPGEVRRELERALSEPAARPDPAAELARIEAASQGHAERRARAIELYVRGLVSSDELETQLAQLERESAVLQQRQRSLRAAGGEAQALDAVEDALQQFQQKLTGNLTPAQRRALIELLVDHAEVRSGEGKAVHLAVCYRVLVSRMSEELIPPKRSTCRRLPRLSRSCGRRERCVSWD